MKNHNEMFVIQNGDGKFLAVDANSGGYPCWTDSLSLAEKFQYDERGLSYAKEAKTCKINGHPTIMCRKIIIDDGITVEELEEKCAKNIREEALAKPSAAERAALGVE